MASRIGHRSNGTSDDQRGSGGLLVNGDTGILAPYLPRNSARLLPFSLVRSIRYLSPRRASQEYFAQFAQFAQFNTTEQQLNVRKMRIVRSLSFISIIARRLLFTV